MRARLTRAGRRAGVLAAAVGALLLAPSGTPEAAAHPLGNFTINHYDGLTLHPDRIDIHAVLDMAEIPTVQERPTTDTDHDGTISAAEAAAAANRDCTALTADLTLSRDGKALTIASRSAAVEYPPGQQGLATTRLTCELTARADLSGSSTITFADTHLADHVGWREITATGVGLALPASDVPGSSASNELRAYPADLLTDPLNIRTARISVAPGSGGTGLAVVAPTGLGPLDRLVAELESTFSDVAGSTALTPTVGLLAVGLALLLGASHAALPGHGKTVMAAYLAGRQGSRRDALWVGATVTLTHTAGVLLLGLAVTLAAAFAAESALKWLGVLSGLLVAAVGVGLLRTALARGPVLPEPALVGAGNAVAENAVETPAVGHGHGHSHGHGHGHGHGPGKTWSRSGLIGMGVAGGLVPSPTALVVLLGAIALGRTWFGVALVLCYGLGMAGTLTAAGLLLVNVRDRLARSERAGAWRERGDVVLRYLPMITATLVLVVGLGLALRSLLT